MERSSLTAHEIANYCSVTRRTVVQWINEGKIKAYRTPGNHSRVKPEDFIKFLNQFNMPIPEDFIDCNPDRKKRILIVDDDKEMVGSIQSFLKREKKYDIAVAYDGFEAGKKFVEVKPDLVILDIKMPGLDGYSVCAKIREHEKNKTVKIISMSGLAGKKDIDKILKLGADDHIKKPFQIKELKAKIHSCFGWDRRTTDKVAGRHG